jgi:hypothetical protein
VSEGFFERWSRRKVDVREGKAVEAEPAIELENRVPPPQLSPEGGGSVSSLPPPPGEGRAGGAGTSQAEPAPLTLEDVKALTTESDFSRFVAPEVAPEVKNAALKKLFADPRYNIMDKLDVYVDDYTKPDPIPEAMLRKLATARSLGLFEDKEQAVAGAARDVADDGGVQSVAQSPEIPEEAPEPSVHDDPDLRLQQDDAAAGEEPGRSSQ